MPKQKVLVTGGTGYLGARIGVSLAAHGYDVYLGSRRPFSLGIIEGCSQIVTNWEDPELAFCDGYDVIIHAAGMNAHDCVLNPNLAIEFNGKATELLVQKAEFYGCKWFIYLSTLHVYKAPLVGTFSEDSPTLNDHPYATSHLYGEKALLNTLKKSVLKGCVLRLSNCFGPPVAKSEECWSLVLNQFVQEACTENTITINSNYLSKRDFLPITTLNQILIVILKYRLSLPSIVNVSSGESRTLLEVAVLVTEMITNISKRKIVINKHKSSKPEVDLIIQNNALKGMGISVDQNLTQEINDLILDVSVKSQ